MPPSAPPPSRPASASTRLAARFVLRRRIGTGGMGEVFEAWDETAREVVALKLLHPSLARDEEIRRRFSREAAALAAIEHPSVVRVVGWFEDAQRGPVLAMERLVGETLEDRIARGGPMEPCELLPLSAAAASALDEVHAHGIVHADVKPANLFLQSGRSAAAKLVDFGLCKVQGLERLTRTGELRGTPRYMAPEVVTGAAPPGPPIDVYGLGATLFEALAGRPPFTERHTGRLLLDVAAGRRPSLTSLRPDLPPSLVQVVERALSLDPAGRPASAGAFQDAFAAAIR